MVLSSGDVRWDWTESGCFGVDGRRHRAKWRSRRRSTKKRVNLVPEE
jgi:hypothetical protein